MTLVQSPVSLLLLNASPRREGHTADLLQAATVGLADERVKLTSLSLADRTILPCQMCLSAGQSCTTCDLADDFQELAQLWQEADAILLGAPVYTFGPPAPLAAFFERMRTTQEYTDAFQRKPVGILAQGGASSGGVEITAQVLMEQVLSLGAIPVSGDMPGASQGVLGQVGDGESPSESMRHAAKRLATRVVELTHLLHAETLEPAAPLQLLVVVDAPRLGETAHRAAQEAIDSARDRQHVDTTIFDAAGARIAPCLACTEHCSANLECVYQDDMQRFRSGWLAADAVLWVIETDRGGPSANLRNAIDRMNQMRFEAFFATGQAHMPRYLQAVGTLLIGREPAGMGKAAQYLDHTTLLYQCVPVRDPLAAEGSSIVLRSGETWPPQARTTARQLGEAVIDMAARLRAGVLAGGWPDEYYPSSTQWGGSDRGNSRSNLSDTDIS